MHRWLVRFALLRLITARLFRRYVARPKDTNTDRTSDSMTVTPKTIARLTISYGSAMVFFAFVGLWVHSWLNETRLILDDSPRVCWFFGSWEGKITCIRHKTQRQSDFSGLRVTPADVYRSHKKFKIGKREPLLDRSLTFDYSSFDGVWSDGYTKSTRGLHFPHWFPAIIFATLSIVMRPGRRLQFTLRDLLAFVTIAATIAILTNIANALAVAP